MVTSVSSSSNATTTGTSTGTGSTAAISTNSAKAAAQSLITSLGSGSGVDINSLANNLANAEISPQKAAIQGKIDKSNATISGYAAIKFVLGNLQTSFADLKDQSDFSSINSSNSQPTAFNITAGASASTGSHSVVVNTIAKPQRTLSGGFASATTALNDGNAFTLSISVHGGNATTVSIPKGYTSPQDMVTAINASNTGVKAQLVNTGSGANPYRIMLSGPTGVANDFTITSSLSSPPAPAAPRLTKIDGDNTTPTTETNQVDFASGLKAGESVTVGGLTFKAGKDLTAAQVATAFTDLASGSNGKTGIAYGQYSGNLTGFSTGSVNVAGTGFTATSITPDTDVSDLQVSTGAADYFNWGELQTATDATLSVDGMDISSASNTVKDAIAGVTLNLITPTSGSEGATVSLGRDTSVVKTKIQALVSSYNDALSMLGVVSDPKSTVDTYGGTLVGNNVVSTIRNQIRNMVVGDSNSPSGKITAFRDIGVSIDKSGKLQVDNTKLDASLQTSFDDVVKMLSNNQENQSKFSQAPAGLAGEAYKKLGVTLDPIGGTLETLSNNQSQKINEYQKQLDVLASRLQTLLARYTSQFSVMDSLVGQIKSSQSGLKSSFDGMMAAYTNK